MRKFKIAHRANDPNGDASDREVIPWSVVAEEHTIEPGQDWEADEAVAEGMAVRLFKVVEVLQLPNLQDEYETVYAYELPRNVGEEILLQGVFGEWDVLNIEAAGQCTVDVEELT